MAKDMPCGLCCVCDDLVDHSELGICKVCGGAFHWNHCGQWERSEHTCDNCSASEEDEDDD